MGNGPEVSEYAIRRSKDYRALRKGSASDLRAQVADIEDELAENPDQYESRTTVLGQNMFVYNHQQSAFHITYRIDRTKKEIVFLHLVAPRFEENKSLSINYSNTDEKWSTELQKWLQPLEKKSFTILDYKDIMDIKNWLDREGSSARAAVLLVTPDYLNLDFVINGELPSLLKKAEKEGLKVLWIAVSTTNVQDTKIAKFTPVNDPSKPLDVFNTTAMRNQEYLRIYEKIKEEVLA